MTTPTDVALVVVLIGWMMFVFYVLIAAIVKRFHDRGKSAAQLALFLVLPVAFFTSAFFVGWPPQDKFPGAKTLMYMGFLLVFINNGWYLIELLVLPGTKGDNRFGPDPLAIER